MTNNFDLRKFLTENKLTSVAKTIKEAEEPQAGQKVASDKLNLTGVNAEINNAKSFAKAVIGLANKLGEREGFNPESNPHIRKAMEYLNAAAGNAAQEGVTEAPNMPPVPGNSPSASSGMTDRNKNAAKEALFQVIATTASFKKAGILDDNEVKTLEDLCQKAMSGLNEETALNESEVNELHGGYLEVMGDEFHEAAQEIALAWDKWRNGPATEPEDIEPAREDVIEFLKSMVR